MSVSGRTNTAPASQQTTASALILQSVARLAALGGGYKQDDALSFGLLLPPTRYAAPSSREEAAWSFAA